MKRQPLPPTLSLGSICRYKHPDTLAYRKSFLTCDAFPHGIPEALRRNRIDHRKAVPGDSGIRFELAADTAPMRRPLSSFADLFAKNSSKENVGK